jgi:molecular chaperone HscA
MQLIEIQEPNSKTEKHEIAVGIDFGTTNSLVAFSKNHKPYIIDMIPSIVNVEEGKLQVAVKGIRSIKRQLNLPAQGSKNNIEHLKIASAIFKHLKLAAESHLNTSVNKAVVTVPAYFDDLARNAVASAAKLAGLEVLRLISEPTAAAYAYGLENKSEGVYLVYDLGGGTFDVSVLNMQMGVFQVLATSGDSQLGGDDIDALLSKELKISTLDAKRLKENEYKNEYDDIIYPLVERTMKITKRVIAEIDIAVDGIILVGGSTRLPLIKKELKRIFNLPILDNVDPDRVVALGAALQAENLTSSSLDLLIDVVPLSLGMELMGGLHEKIIMRSTPIPATITKEFTTCSDNQNAMYFHIVQGERELVADCRSLAKFELALLPAKAGTHRVEITFMIDADGLVSIKAKDKATGLANEIELKPTYGLSKEEINTMIEVAYENATLDHKARQQREAEIETQIIINKLKSNTS